MRVLFEYMCLFPFKNLQYKSIAYQSGVHEFECGACPECLSKRARLWALRCCMQAKVQSAVMVTLTYDSYIRDSNGKIIGERVANDMTVNKRDCQLFIKRLRRYMEYHYNSTDIKYLITAEYGKRTHRPHYHAILFGVTFEDALPYKRSKRGNMIYKSSTLEKIWLHGICTLDAVNMNVKIARYCTKYCAKDSRADDTFMLMSRGIGMSQLLQEFNGLSYIIDGREYSIPRQVWIRYIENKYNMHGYSKYVNFDKECPADFVIAAEKRYFRQAWKRNLFNFTKRNDFLYKRYINYWKAKNEQFNRIRPDELTRIIQLPDNKYFAYKQAALKSLNERLQYGEDFNIPPRSNCKSRHLKRLFFFAWNNGLPLEKSFAYYPLVTNRQMTQKTLKNGHVISFYHLSEYVNDPFTFPNSPCFRQSNKKHSFF